VPLVDIGDPLFWSEFTVHHVPNLNSRITPIRSFSTRHSSFQNKVCSHWRNKCWCIKWPGIKLSQILSVASRSRCAMSIFDKLFIRQLKLNSLYSILHRNNTKSTRNGGWASWSSLIWLLEIPQCDGGKCCHYVLRSNHTLCAFWQWWAPFSTALWEIRSFINSNSISRSLYYMILRQNK
jgi:hypothetical protein